MFSDDRSIRPCLNLQALVKAVGDGVLRLKAGFEKELHTRVIVSVNRRRWDGNSVGRAKRWVKRVKGHETQGLTYRDNTLKKAGTGKTGRRRLREMGDGSKIEDQEGLGGKSIMDSKQARTERGVPCAGETSNQPEVLYLQDTLFNCRRHAALPTLSLALFSKLNASVWVIVSEVTTLMSS